MKKFPEKNKNKPERLTAAQARASLKKFPKILSINAVRAE